MFSPSLSRTTRPVAVPRLPATGPFLLRQVFIWVGQYLLDYLRVFNAGDQFDGAAAGLERLDVDVA
jgi:hypothetical protein